MGIVRGKIWYRNGFPFCYKEGTPFQIHRTKCSSGIMPLLEYPGRLIGLKVRETTVGLAGDEKDFDEPFLDEK